MTDCHMVLAHPRYSLSIIIYLSPDIVIYLRSLESLFLVLLLNMILRAFGLTSQQHLINAFN